VYSLRVRAATCLPSLPPPRHHAAELYVVTDAPAAVAWGDRLKLAPLPWPIVHTHDP
jgi:hypothetical protein